MSKWHYGNSRESVWPNWYAVSSGSSPLMSTMDKLIKQIEQKFPFNKETDCKKKYNETVMDFLYEEIITKLNK